MDETKRWMRTRGYVKTQQHAYADRGWSSSSTCTGGWWLLWKGVVTHFCNPFSKEMIEAPCPKKFKILSIEPFDGATDPDDHLDVYKAQMYI